MKNIEIDGYLLNADYITVKGKAVVRLWVRAGDDLIIAVDPHFEPYFYAVPSARADAERTKKDIEALLMLPISENNNETENAKEIKNEINRDENKHDEGKRCRCEIVRKKLFGVEHDVIKITVAHPQDVPRLREKVKEVRGVESVNEADILFGHRYLIDRSLVPSGGIRIYGTEIDAAESFDNYEGKLAWATCLVEVKRAEYVERDGPLKPKILAFDIECYNPKAMPDPEKDPIIIISVVTDDGTAKLFHADETSEKSIIQEFVHFIKETDPDVILTYNGTSFDWPYIRKRAEKTNVRLAIGRDGSVPTQDRVIGHLNILGRANIDLYPTVMRDMPYINIKTLKNVADYLGVTKLGERTNIPGEKIAEYWDDREKRKTLLEYAKDDAVSTMKLGMRLLPIQFELGKMIRQPVEDVSRIGRGRQVELYLTTEAHAVGELVPSKRPFGHEGVYEGGFVLNPKRGIHENVICLDFASMYPNIMIAYNISPDTFFGQQEKMEEGTYNEAPEVGYRFRKAPDGFFKKILVNLIQTRKKIKQEMKKLDKRDQRYAVLDVRQYTVKILTNSFYGYTGWLGAKWYRKECAEATAAWGRFIIKSVIERAKEWGFDVYYGDTDSIFCTYSDKIPRFVEAINKEFPLDLDVQELYTAIFFTGKKKRYAGLTANGEIIIRGLEVRRGDWCELAKKIQKEIIGIILRQRDVKPAEELVKKTIENIRGGNVSIDDLTIYKSLTRRLDEYKSKQAHVRAVEKAMDEGLDFNVGEKVGYVVLKNKPKTKKSAERRAHGGLESKDGEKMSDRTKLVSLLDESDKIDYEYYIDKQILPAALRILEYFGTSEESLKNVPKQTGLDTWF